VSLVIFSTGTLPCYLVLPRSLLLGFSNNVHRGGELRSDARPWRAHSTRTKRKTTSVARSFSWRGGRVASQPCPRGGSPPWRPTFVSARHIQCAFCPPSKAFGPCCSSPPHVISGGGPPPPLLCLVA
jgi:hypothetical protein